MKIIKLSSNYLKLKSKTGKYGPYEAYSVEGTNTFAIKDRLKSMGFSWNGLDKSWDISASKMNPDLREKVKLLGVIDESGGAAPQQQAEVEAPKSASGIDKTKTDNPEYSKWYKFPIKDDIYKTTITINVDGREVEYPLKVHRSFQVGKDTSSYDTKPKKSREGVGKPKYYFQIGERTNFKNRAYNIEEYAFHKSPNTMRDNGNQIDLCVAISKNDWGTYDEESFILDMIEKIKAKYSNPTKAEVLSIEETARGRTPELQDYLNKFESKYEKVKITEQDVENTGYVGEYKVYVGLGYTIPHNPSGVKTVHIDPSIDDPVVQKYYNSLKSDDRVEVDISSVKTIDDFNMTITNALNSPNLKSKILNILKSVPFLAEQKEIEKETLMEYADILLNPDDSYYQVATELKNRGYIRRNKREKQGLGLITEDNAKWVLESKMITNKVYGRDFDLYDVIAYVIHHRVRNIQGWGFMMTSFQHALSSKLQIFFPEINYKKLEESIYKISINIIASFFPTKQHNRTTWEQFQDFYGNDWNSKSESYDEPKARKTTFGNPVEELTEFAKKYYPDIDIQEVATNIKGVFRDLTKKTHPDKFQDPLIKSEKEKEFKILVNIWDKIPMDIRQSFNLNIWRMTRTAYKVDPSKRVVNDTSEAKSYLEKYNEKNMYTYHKTEPSLDEGEAKKRQQKVKDSYGVDTHISHYELISKPHDFTGESAYWATFGQYKHFEIAKALAGKLLKEGRDVKIYSCHERWEDDPNYNKNEYKKGTKLVYEKSP